MSNENLMSGYTVNISTVIKLNLENYKYVDGFPILKELIQNACDAGATELKIGHYEGKSDAKNPLLQKRGIIVYNNGAFTDDDGNNIAKIGGENKRNDRSTIGKYGLGLKSIYHLCEAFFFYGHEACKLRGVCPYFNGFATDAKHESWVSYSDEDRAFLQKTIDTFVGKVNKGLSLIIPIDNEEKDSIVGGKRNIDVDHPFNKGDVNDERLISNVITSLAILSKTAKKNALKTFYYALKDKTVKLQMDENSCKVSVCLDGQKVSVREISFSSVEINGFDNINFVDENAKRIIERLKKSIVKIDKILDEGKVVLQFIRIPKIGATAKLKIVFAVYLPLPDQEHFRSSCDIDGENDYILVCHAPFAIDSGRRHIEDFKNLCSDRVTEDIFRNSSLNLDMQQVLYRWWNKSIFQFIVAPNIAAALFFAVNQRVLNELECQMVVKEIRNSFGEGAPKRLDYLFSKNGFVCRYNKDGHKEWTLCNLTAKLVNVPETSDESIMCKIGKFAQDNGNLLLVLNTQLGSEYFLPLDLVKNNIDTVGLQKFIETLPDELFCDKSGLDYVISLLRANCKQFSPGELEILGKTLNAKLKSLLRNAGLKYVQQNELRFDDLCTLLSESYAFNVHRLNIPATSDIWSKLWDDSCPFVLLPTFGRFFAPAFLNDETQQISWLSFLSHTGLDSEIIASLLKELVGSIERVLGLIRNRFRDTLDVFELVDVKDGSRKFLNYGNLERSVTFKWFDGSDNYAVKLANLVTCKICKIRPLEGVNSFDCSKQGVLDCLACHFAEWSSEGLFIDSEKESFLKSIFDYTFRTASASASLTDIFAFLLSGFDLDAVKNKSVSIFKKDCCEILKKIYFRCSSIVGQRKKVVDVDEDRYAFIENHRNILQNVFVDENDCIQLLAKTDDISFLKEQDFSKERAEIIRKVWQYSSEFQQKDSLYLRLPIHINCNGKFCSFSSAGDMFFNKQGIEIPMDGGFKDHLIAKDTDSSLAAFQDRVYTTDNKRILTNTKAVYILFCFAKSPEELSLKRSWILDNLRLAPNGAPEEERNLLMETKWIRLKDGGYCGLKDILLSDFCDPSTLNTLHQCIPVFGLYDTELSLEEQEVVRGIIKKNYRPDSYKNTVLQIIKEKLSKQIVNIGYILFDDMERDQWSRSLEVFEPIDSMPIFRIFYRFSKDPMLKNVNFFDFYKELYSTNVLNHKVGLTLLEQLVTYTCDPLLKKLFCKIVVLLNDGSFDISQASHYPTRVDKWETSDNISCEGDENSIPDRYKLPEELRFFELSCGKREENTSGANKDLSPNEALDIINNSWRNRCQNPSYIDVILFLLQKKYRKNASCQSNVENALKELFDHAEATQARSNTTYWCDAMPVADRRTVSYNDSFDVKMTTSIQDGSLTTVSLNGTPLSVERNLKEVYYRNHSFTYNAATKTYEIVIFKLADSDGDNFVDASVDRFLQSILSNIYRLHLTDELLSPFIKQIQKVDQISIGAARARIFDGLFYILKGVKHPTFKRLDAQMNKLYEKSEGRGLSSSESSNKLNNELIREIEKDETLQSAIFRYVRGKVKQNQYSVNSILFELFQNADDSVNDLFVNGRVIGETEKKIIVKNDTNNNRIKVTHFGRKINEIFGNENDDKYKWDLLNMLSLSYSDKDSKLGDTGKFGLGFKSVYMLTEKPIVRSGELQFEIVAGLYPQTINHDPAFRNCTYFELSYKSPEEAKACLDRFLSCSAYISLFSKHIKVIEAVGAVNATKLEKLNIDLPNAKCFTTEISGTKYLLLDVNKDGFAFKLMFKQDSDRLVALDENDSVPRVWNLSPLEAAKRLPFIINADFELDTGRLNLAGNGVNRMPIDLIATIFSEIVVALDKVKRSYVDDILNLMLKSYAMQDSEVFKPLADKVLHVAFRTLHRIPTGFGTALEATSTSKVLALAPTAYTDHDDEFLREVQRFATTVSNGIKIVSATVLAVFKNDMPGCLESSIFSIFELIPDKILSCNILENFMPVAEYFTARYSFWKDFNRKQSLADYKLMNMEDDYTRADRLILDYDDRVESSLIIHQDYTGNDSIRHFLVENQIFERNHNRYLQNQIATPSPIAPNTPNSPAVHYDEDGDLVDSSIVELSVNDLQKLYANRDIVVDAYYEKLYNSNFYDAANRCLRNQEDLQQAEWNETWCILLLTAVCQSLPFYNHQESSIRVAVSYLKDKGVIQAFLSQNANVLQTTYDTFVKTTEYAETCLRPFEMLLRLYKIKGQFETFHMLLRSLPLDPTFNSIEEILTTETNHKLEGTAVHLYSIDRSFKKGMHFLLRELLRNGFWDDFDKERLETIRKQAFMPKHRVLTKLGLGMEATSADIYNKISSKFANIINDPTLDNTYDILFLA